jgi:hypothetical protein
MVPRDQRDGSLRPNSRLSRQDGKIIIIIISSSSSSSSSSKVQRVRKADSLTAVYEPIV